jgi:predicted ATPase
MIEKITGGKSLPAEVQRQIVNKTDGVPLFVEELTKSIIEAVGATHASPLQLAIPATLHDSLMTRLDRLGTAKEVAQLGATLGREFSYELIHAVAPGNEGSLQHALTKLVEAEVLYQRGLPPQARYVFKHALIQDAAYQSLLKSRRQQYHQQIAQVLEQRFVEITDTQSELVAHHYTESGFVEQAIPYWQQAGQKAIERSANVEAIRHVTKALEVLKALPDTPARAQQELMLQITLGAPLMATKGYAALEVVQVYNRARELCQQMGETPQLFPVLHGLWMSYNVQAEHQTARALGERLFSIAQSVQDTALLLEAHFALGETLFLLGELASAQVHLRQGIDLYDVRQHRAHAFLYGQDSGVFCLGLMAFALWLRGYPDQASKRVRQGLLLTQELTHLNSLGGSLFFAAMFHQFCREAYTVQERAETLIVLAKEHELPFWLAEGTFFGGWALAEQGQEEDGITQMRRGLIALQTTEAKLGLSHRLSLLAEAHGKKGDTGEGLKMLTEALDIVSGTGECWWEAELYRLKGTLTLESKVESHKSKVEEAEACFLKAIEIARRQQAKSLELRAAMSLSRLWQQQGKKDEARQMLADVYNWFTEGFDTRDLQDAKALLEELG